MPGIKERFDTGDPSHAEEQGDYLRCVHQGIMPPGLIRLGRYVAGQLSGHEEYADREIDRE
jgi:hypothetical protein